MNSHLMFICIYSGLNQGVTGLPLKGWPLTVSYHGFSLLCLMLLLSLMVKLMIGNNVFLQGIDNLRPGMGLQVQKPNMQNQNQLYLASQQQQVLAHAQAQGNHGALPHYGLGGLARGNLSMKDGQSTRNDGPIGSPGQMNSPKVKIFL